jgi:MerR family transcriptional regulator, light-induced transcriptional regulator
MQLDEMAKERFCVTNAQQWQSAFLDATFRFNKLEAQALLHQAFYVASSEEVCTFFIHPILQQIGDLWQENKLTWVHENFASTIIYTILSEQLNMLPAYKKSGPHIFMSGVPEEAHEIGLLIHALVWKSKGFNISYHCPYQKVDDLMQEIEKARPEIVCLSANIHSYAKSLVPISRYLTEQLLPLHPLLVYGGRAFLNGNPLQQEIQGIYLGANVTASTQYLARLVKHLTAPQVYM